METQTTTPPPVPQGSFERRSLRIVRCMIGVAGMLFVTAIIIAFGWLIFLCWLFGSKTNDRTNQSTH